MAIDPQFHEVVKEGPIVIWKFSNPPRNLISPATGEELRALVTEFDQDPELRVGIITSATPGNFIQHFDVAAIIGWAEELGKLSDDEIEQMRANMPEPTGGISHMTNKPVICSINGPVQGGGCELSLECDFRFISKDAYMGQPEVGAGFPPGYGIPKMIQLIGLPKTLEFCMTGRKIYPDEAERIGLVNRSCPPEELDAEVMKFALTLAALPPQGITSVKETIYKAVDMTLIDGLKINSSSFFDSIRDEDSLKRMRLYVAADQDGEKMFNVMMEAEGDMDKAMEMLQKESSGK
jgi:enoyl-CoA hydratase/carnithine racemase